LSLDDSVLAAQVEQARAELGLARTSFERTEDLAKRNFVSGSARDQAAATLKVQAARLELAQAQLAKTRIVAPFAGVLGLRNVSVGDFVKDGAELVMLEDVSSMKVDLRLPERFLGQLRKGQSIRLRIDAFPGREFTARLDALDAQVDANGRSLLARGVLPNPDASLRAGMFAKARIVLREKPAAIVIPEEAILPSGGQASVFRVVDGKAVRTRVETGMRLDGKVEILSGIAGGDLVVTAGQLRLRRDAMPVSVTEQAGARTGGAAGAAAAAPNGKASDQAPAPRKPGA
jgi:membrane fusion protein (multidrug efflux system)